MFATAATCRYNPVPMSKDGPVDRVLRSPVLGVVGVVADVTAVILLVNSHGFLGFARAHTGLLMFVFAGVLALLIGSANAWLRLRGISKAPTDQDKNRFANFLTDFGLDSPLYKWLKDGYMVDKAFNLGHHNVITTNLLPSAGPRRSTAPVRPRRRSHHRERLAGV